MSTKSKANKIQESDPICQGDIFRNVKYSYIDSEDDSNVQIIEFEFPYAIILSQACDVIAMDQLLKEEKGKITKFMPSILMCPIYEKDMLERGEHINDVFNRLSITIDKDNILQKDDYKVAARDWHYRFHVFSIYVEDQKIIEKFILDFKHYFTVPAKYLIQNKKIGFIVSMIYTQNS